MLMRLILRVFLALISATVLILATPVSALGYGNGVHLHLAQQAVELMSATDPHAIIGTDLPYGAARTAAGAHMLPWLTWGAMGTTNGAWLAGYADTYDAVVGDLGTRSHFWEADDGLHEKPEGIDVDNAWEKAHMHWEAAIHAYWLQDQVTLWANLGAVLHLMGDVSQPAHVNSDLHGPTNRDSLEEWGDHVKADALLSWTAADRSHPPKVYAVPTNQQIITRVRNSPSWQPGQVEFFGNANLMNPNDAYNEAQLFYIMYRTDQSANYFASDGEGGNRSEPMGWVDYSTGFPKHLHNANGVAVTPWSETALDDNDAGCKNDYRCGAPPGYCDCDKDLTTIALYCYGFGMQANVAVLDLFRRTVDVAAPQTTVVNARTDGRAYEAGAWNNSPVTMTLQSVVDPPRADGYNYSGVWSAWGLVDGHPMTSSPTPVTTPLSKTVFSSGWHKVAVRSTDWMGRIEQQDYVVGVDVDEPVISLPGFSVSALYYPCESYAGSWKVTDAHSGVFGQGLAAVDGKFLAKGATVAMSDLGLGTHLISVSAWDSAGNWAQKNQQFDVGIETGTVVGSPKIVGGVQPVAKRSFLLSGTLAPRHKVGQKPIELRLYRLIGGKYAYQKSVWAQVNARQKYVKAVRFAAPGTYRVVAMHRWPTKLSSALQFKVKGIVAR